MKTKQITPKQLKAKMEKLKKVQIDGRIFVAIMGSLLTRAKLIQREIKKKNINSLRLHDLNVQSHTLSIIVDDMLQAFIKETIRQELEKKQKHARVGRK